MQGAHPGWPGRKGHTAAPTMRRSSFLSSKTGGLFPMVLFYFDFTGSDFFVIPNSTCISEPVAGGAVERDAGDLRPGPRWHGEGAPGAWGGPHTFRDHSQAGRSKSNGDVHQRVRPNCNARARRRPSADSPLILLGLESLESARVRFRNPTTFEFDLEMG